MDGRAGGALNVDFEYLEIGQQSYIRVRWEKTDEAPVFNGPSNSLGEIEINTGLDVQHLDFKRIQCGEPGGAVKIVRKPWDNAPRPSAATSQPLIGEVTMRPFTVL